MQNKSKEVETSSADSLILQKNFEYLLKQVQDVQKNQATSKVSLNQMEEYLYRMNMVMTNTKLRGNWGEYQLDMLLSVYCGQKSIYLFDAVYFAKWKDCGLCFSFTRHE